METLEATSIQFKATDSNPAKEHSYRHIKNEQVYIELCEMTDTPFQYPVIYA